jgi:Membrane domain of glycerophosphoryl diester phosphodiesterase
LNRLRGRIWRLVGLGLLVGLLSLLALVVFIIPGIYVFVLLAFATPAFVLEKTTVRGALSRSSELVRGSWWRTLGIGLLGYLVAVIIAGIIELPFALFAASSAGLFSTTASVDVSTTSEILLAVGRVIGGAVTTPIGAGTIALMYVDRRMRREGLDIALAQTARERRGRS